VRIILEAQDEAAAYHNSLHHMDQAGYIAPAALPTEAYSFLNATGADPYPIDPFPRTFWYMFFLISPTAALIWYNAVELTFDGLMVCVPGVAHRHLRPLRPAKAACSQAHEPYLMPCPVLVDRDA
jgi:hypothetical protein